jgi:3-phenylpropionate/trans-cinnamate dioxygenase ferredoxin subunit
VNRVNVGPADAFEAGRFCLIQAGTREIGVLRMGDGSFRALRNRCPHKAARICRGIVGGTWPPSAPGELEYSHEGRILVCPWHGFEYDLDTGQELFRPGAPGLRMDPAEVIDGEVWITLRQTESANKGA